MLLKDQEITVFVIYEVISINMKNAFIYEFT